jgi:hypothetical protein
MFPSTAMKRAFVNKIMNIYYSEFIISFFPVEKGGGASSTVNQTAIRGLGTMIIRHPSGVLSI